MRKINLLPLAILWLAILACTRAAPAPPTPAPSPVPPTALAPTAVPSPTPTPLPTPTSIPRARVESGDKALFNGDWETALSEFQTAYKNTTDSEIRAAALLGTAQARWMERNLYETALVLEKLLAEYPDFAHKAQAYFLQAQVATAQEHPEQAAEAYTKYLELRPGLIDAYILDLRGDARFAAKDYPAAVKDFEAALLRPSHLDETFLRLKLARSYALAGDSPTALTLYDDLYGRNSDENTRALIDLRKNEIYTTLGQGEQATAACQDAVQNYPTSYNTYACLTILVDAGIPVDELQRGIIDYYAKQYGPALAALDRYLQGNPSDPATAQYYYALTLRKQGEYAGAVQRWDKVIQDDKDHALWDDAWEQKAYTLWHDMDQYPQAVQTLLQFVEKYPVHGRAAEFLFDAASIAEQDDQIKQAAELWERVAREYPGDERSGRALFLTGITQYRLKEYPLALDAFQRYLAQAGTLYDRAAAQFWSGKAQLGLGDAAAARAAWEKAAEIDPTGYYSERARDLLYQRPAFDAPLSYDITLDPINERTRAEAWMRSTFSLPEGTNLSTAGSLAENPAIQRGAELWQLGLYDDARAEFESVRLSAQLDPALSYQLANYLIAMNVYRPGVLTTRQVLDIAGMDDAATLNAPVYFNHIRFGTYYSDLIIPLAKKYGFHPIFLFSVVRQESLFDATVRSSAGANGLMQIIPATGEDIARDLGWPENYATEDLVRPLVNLTLGTDYLATQRDRFNGDLFAALAAYNGGPTNADRWLQLAPDDPDLFLEVIRFVETRDYIRRVYELYSIYRWLYDRTS